MEAPGIPQAERLRSGEHIVHLGHRVIELAERTAKGALVGAWAAHKAFIAFREIPTEKDFDTLEAFANDHPSES